MFSSLSASQLSSVSISSAYVSARLPCSAATYIHVLTPILAPVAKVAGSGWKPVLLDASDCVGRVCDLQALRGGDRRPRYAALRQSLGARRREGENGPCSMPLVRKHTRLLLTVLLLKLLLTQPLLPPHILRAGSPGTASTPACRRALWLFAAPRATCRGSCLCPCMVASCRSQSVANLSILRW